MTPLIASSRPSARSARIEVLEPGTGLQDDDAIGCEIGRDLTIKAERLGAYCLRELPTRLDDLVLIAGAVAYADRAVPRRVARTWRRGIELVVPAREPDFWGQPAVTKSLTGVLGVLTGDGWAIEFTERRAPLPFERRQTPFPFQGGPAVVMPFSDGLDSLAAARLTAAARPDAGLILVTTGSLPDTDLGWWARHLNGDYHRVSVPFELAQRGSTARLREPSFRSRAFVFGVMAGVAAHLLGAERVIVPESGQGALGPWLTPVGNEAPDLRMHPLYTARLAAFLRSVFGQALRFEHPRLWSTKGETLAELRAAGLDSDWSNTRSCGRDARHVHHHGRRIQCGVCANCLLRRQSVMAAGLDTLRDRYLWHHLAAPSLAGAAAGPSATTDNDERYAKCGALALEELSRLAASAQPATRWAAADLSDVLDDDAGEVERKLDRLLAVHRDEWDAFVAAQGPASFLARLRDGARC
jgi:7-cyano-7-deazaguanine synthase in queuosine biosynthesis